MINSPAIFFTLSFDEGSAKKATFKKIINKTFMRSYLQRVERGKTIEASSFTLTNPLEKVQLAKLTAIFLSRRLKYKQEIQF